MSNFFKSVAFPMAIVVMLIGIAALALGVYTLPEQECPLGSVEQGSEYNYRQFTGAIATTTQLKSGQGVFGSVIITEDQAGAVVFYDATSTTAYSKTNGTRIADLQAALTEGTYTFDVAFTKGLVMESVDGFLFAGDWTTTWR